MSRRALHGARLAAALGAVCALVLPAASSGASHRSASLGISNVTVTTKWKEGWLTGAVHFTVASSGNTSAIATVRPYIKSGLPSAHQVYTLVPGTTNETLKLPPRPKPGTYVLTINAAHATKFVIPNPPEGVVDLATISTTEGGHSVHVLSNPHKVWVRFHFLAAPPGAKTVKIAWRTPSYTFLGAVTKPYAATIDSDLASNATFPKGKWYAILTVDGRTAKRVEVRVS